MLLELYLLDLQLHLLLLLVFQKLILLLVLLHALLTDYLTGRRMGELRRWLVASRHFYAWGLRYSLRCRARFMLLLRWFQVLIIGPGLMIHLAVQNKKREL